jgi:hypothetical protein
MGRLLQPVIDLLHVTSCEVGYASQAEPLPDVQTTETVNLLIRTAFVMIQRPCEISVDHIIEQSHIGCLKLSLPGRITPLADFAEEHPRLPPCLINIDDADLTDSKFPLLLAPRAVSQDELRLTARVYLDPKSPDFGVPTPTYGQLFD